MEKIMIRHGIPQRFRQDLNFGLGHVPVILQRELWTNLQILLISGLICRNRQLEYSTPIDFPTELPGFLSAVYNTEQSESYQEQILTGGYGLEEKLLNAAKKGNIDQASRLAVKYVNFQIKYHEQFGLKPHYAVVELNTLLRRAAMEMGVHILRLDETFVKYNRLAEQQQGPFQATYTDMVADYCKLIQKYSRQNYSAAVKKSLDYIDFNYEKDISLHKLADMFHVSDGHLSSSFKKEIGVSITDYLSQTRVSHARWLLKSTEYSVQEIGVRCGFADASYFTRIFKRHVGQSPLQYRITRSLL